MSKRVLTGMQAFRWAEVFDLETVDVNGVPVAWWNAGPSHPDHFDKATLTVDIVPMGWTPEYLARAARSMPEIHPLLVEMRALYDAEQTRMVDVEGWAPAVVEVRRFFNADRPANGSASIEQGRATLAKRDAAASAALAARPS